MTDPARRVIFLDFDGTYAHHGKVPPGHAQAVQSARAAGHAVLLCTGRPISALPDGATDAGFDGIVATAGAYVELDGRVLADIRFPTALARRTVDALDAHGTLYILEAPEALYARPGAAELLDRAHRAYDPGYVEQDERRIRIDETDNLRSTSFAKVICFGGDSPVAAVAHDIGDEVTAIPSSIPEFGDGAGELYQSHLTKDVGMRIVVDALGMGRERVIAFGDGLNDLEMLAFASTAVAIEGSHPRVLAVADRIARGPVSEGLVAAFAELGLAG